MKLLHVDSSINGDGSVSRRLSAAITAAWRDRVPALDVTYRDLAAEPLGHLTGPLLAAQAGAGAAVTGDIADELATSGEVLDEFLAADVVVVGAPMYNFSIPTQLRAWIDRLAVAGKTFRYTEAGPEGLAGDKKVIVVSSRGGAYGDGTPAATADFQEPYLRQIFGFFGIADIDFVRAEGLALGPDQRDRAIADAERSIAGRLAA